MKKHLITFADKKFQKAQSFCLKEAKKFSIFDTLESYGPPDIDSKFYTTNQGILSQERGAGYWLWKPYFIKEKLNQINNGDLVMYCDSATFFRSTPYPLCNLTEIYNTDIICFELEPDKIERFYTKKHCFELLNCKDAKFTDTPQRLASYIIIKKSPESLDFIDVLLRHCQEKDLITDDLPANCIENYSGFIDHRHDQSIFSLLTKKYNIKPFRDPSQWGNPLKQNYDNSEYDQIIEHTRQKKPKQATVRYKIKKIFQN